MFIIQLLQDKTSNLKSYAEELQKCVITYRIQLKIISYKLKINNCYKNTTKAKQLK